MNNLNTNAIKYRGRILAEASARFGVAAVAAKLSDASFLNAFNTIVAMAGEGAPIELGVMCFRS